VVLHILLRPGTGAPGLHPFSHPDCYRRLAIFTQSGLDVPLDFQASRAEADLPSPPVGTCTPPWRNRAIWPRPSVAGNPAFAKWVRPIF